MIVGTARRFENCWMLNLFKIGQDRDLDETDLYTTLDDQVSSSLGDKLEKEWRLELTNAYSANRTPSLPRALIKMFGYKYMFIGFIFAINDIIFKVSGPLLVGGLLAYFNPDGSNTTDLKNAYMYASGIVLSLLIIMILQHSSIQENLQCAMKMRVACCSIIFRKALCLSQTALGETTVGQVINLISNDVGRFDVAMTSIHYIWIGPLLTTVVIYFLWHEIGISSLIGVSGFLFFIPLQCLLGKKMSEYRLKTATITDERIRLMNEIISGIQIIKMYTWEKPFAKLIEHTRKKEMKQIRITSFLGILTFAFQVVQAKLQLFISILSFMLLGNNISIRKVFVLAAFFSVLQQPMTRFFGRGLAQLAELKISLKRIQNFMLLEEKDSKIPNLSTSAVKPLTIGVIKSDINTDNLDIKKNPCSNGFGIVFSNASAKWTDIQTCNTLENINLNIIPGRLVAIIGPVGSGKSSLLQAVLRELPLSTGKISVCGKVSYAAQEPWLFAGTVQQNILFGSPMDKERYKQVISVCALKTDFKQFPHGDRTLVGERGVTLSGGQRSRINVARAIYKQADIYLLDDPLSAVDSKVGRHLFEKCIKDYLKEKACVLITHQVQYLTDVDQIILMDNGSIVAEGSYQELQATAFEFAKSLGSSDDTRTNDPENDTNNSLNAHMVSTLLGSNKSISSSQNDVNVSGDLAEKSKNTDKSRSSGRVSIKVYRSYLSANGSVFKVFLVLFCFILTQVLATGVDYWISFWISHEEYVLHNTISYNISNNNGTLSSSDSFTTLLFSSNFRQNCMILYAIILIFLIITIIVRCVTYVLFCTRASINVHNQMFDRFIKATMLFFNTRSSGDMLNRFSKDIGAVDEMLPYIIFDCLQLAMLLLGIIFIVGFVNSYLMIPTCIMVVVFYKIRVFNLPTSRSIKRLEGITRSPVFAHMKETLRGLTTIRAYKVEQILINEFDEHQDLHSSAWNMYICANQAFGLWLDLVSITYIGIVIFSFFAVENDHGGNIGLTITQTITLTSIIQWGVRQLSVLENQMTSVERILEYTDLPQEADFQSPAEKAPPNEWPFSGKIEFQNFNLRYSLDSPYVLKNLNFQIQPMEKIGIVGRTGAGKSSIIGALFRFAFNEGSIIIDDIEIHKLGLHDLRSKFSIIPQEPVLFSGTMRTNLDPFDEYPDLVLWNALDEVELKTVVEKLPGGLNSKMSAFGSNFSVGQRQLLCLARAIVRNNKIIILDEATANVDPQTDVLIQNTIRNKFKLCTVLTIAHRLNTIMDSDRVLVMDAGTVVEFDHSYNLLKNKDGFLYKMVEQTGIITSELLHNMASESFNVQTK
ncbi:probable multidrug resistance-associated protein lethal(2)03659 isoform X2 [Acyrthosiphon pisum]|uniref:Multidrug resistance-associated protein lethal(2)03659 n=1 Tax=Acyrthosiphon pisum TaxID=7029 RepID=A0A8R2B923_ACYPI|nr:probable multidrug resistance-associated protein lethal(2)03659 isoform X2 [Acyrthosiphon pisum]|eukprot:XP_008187158.1 PREDICTED: probable multidrug resistance-associated protein lethal(2)03659 isoform X2 [Acyrthosiphon pisum]